MEFQDIKNAYRELSAGTKSPADVLSMYQAMPDKTAAFEDGDTLLHLAAAQADLQAVQYLLAQGCDPNARNEEGRSPLWLVALLDETEDDFPGEAVYAVTSALLKGGAESMQQDGDGAWLHQEAAENESETYLRAVHDHLQSIQDADKAAKKALEERVTLREVTTACLQWRRGEKTEADVLELFQSLADKEEVDEYGNTQLHIAASYLHPEAVRHALGVGCDPNAQNKAGHGPLWSVALIQKLEPNLPENVIAEVTAILLDAGASAQKKDPKGEWCHLAAAKMGNGAFIAALQEKGVRITRADDAGNNGLHLLIGSLGDRVDDLARTEKRYQDALAANAHEETIKREQKALEEKKAMLDYRLSLAFTGVLALLEAGVDPEDQNNRGESAHKIAEKRGAKKIGALLRGDISASSAGGTADAASTDSPVSGDNGAKADLLEKAGGLNLHQAVSKEDHEAIRALVELGADLNEVGDIHGYGEGTPLGMACHFCDYQTVELLLELGADPNFKTGKGTTAISWFSGKHGNIQQIFQENRPGKIVDAMVKGGMDINGTIDDKSNTLLTWALRESQDMEIFLTRESFRWLVVNSAIVHGANVNWANLRGETPLMLASRANPARDMRMADEIQMLLLENGADVAAIDKDGNTPLIHAAQNGSANMAKEMAENLFDFGDPKPEAVNNAGKSALDYAIQRNREALVKLLQRNL